MLGGPESDTESAGSSESFSANLVLVNMEVEVVWKRECDDEDPSGVPTGTGMRMDERGLGEDEVEAGCSWEWEGEVYMHECIDE